MQIDLTPELASMVQARVETGRYAGPLEVVEHALRLAAVFDERRLQRTLGEVEAVTDADVGGDEA